MKREALNHSKLRRLCRRLDIPHYQGVGILECLWHLCGRETPRGDIGKLTDEDIAIALDWRGDETPLISALVDCGWLDQNSEHRFLIHDWHEHADDAVHARLFRSRQFFIKPSSSGNQRVRPKPVKISRRERDEITEWYESEHNLDSELFGVPDSLFGMPKPQNGTPPACQNGHSAPLPCPALPEPCPALPCPASITRKEKSPTRRQRTRNEVASPPPSHSAEKMQWYREELRNFPGAHGLLGEPDDEIVTDCINLTFGNRDLMSKVLKEFHNKNRHPDQSWAWFPAMLRRFRNDGVIQQ